MDQRNSDKNMADLWEQMGSSTGSLLGRMIGTGAEMGLETYRRLVNNPLQDANVSNPPPQSSSGVPSDIREQTWSNMGTQYGETIGSTIGMSMDYFINTMKNITQEMTTSNQQQTYHHQMKKIEIDTQPSGSNKKGKSKSGKAGSKHGNPSPDDSAQL